MFVMAGSCMYVWATSVGLRSAIFSRSLIGFKLSVSTTVAAHGAGWPVTVSGETSQLGLEGSPREVRTDTRGGPAKFYRTTLRPLYIG